MLKTFKMEENNTSCIKRVGGTKICSFCGNILIKHGKSSSNTPRYRCKICKKTQVENYTYKSYPRCSGFSIRYFSKNNKNQSVTRLVFLIKMIKKREISHLIPEISAYLHEISHSIPEILSYLPEISHSIHKISSYLHEILPLSCEILP
jgi:hypothetical protein